MFTAVIRIERLLVICLMALTALNTAPVFSAEKQTFKEAYGYYSQLRKQLPDVDTKELVNAAKQAFDLGLLKFGDNSKNTALLAQNYADSLYENGEYKQSIRALEAAIPYVERAFGKQSQEMLKQYYRMAEEYSLHFNIENIYLQKYFDLKRSVKNGYSDLYRTHRTFIDSYIRQKKYDLAVIELKKAAVIEASRNAKEYDLAVIDDRRHCIENRGEYEWYLLEQAREKYNNLTKDADDKYRLHAVRNLFVELVVRHDLEKAFELAESERIDPKEIYVGNEKPLFVYYKFLVSMGPVEDRSANIKNAIELAKEIYGKKSFQAGMASIELARFQYKNPYGQNAEKLYKEGIAILESDPGRNAEYLAKAHEDLALIKIEDRKWKSAEKYLQRSLQYAMDSTNHTWQVEESIRKNFVALYQKQNKENLATEHCLAIARRQPEHYSANPWEAYSPEPKYPNGAIELGGDGEVVLEFTVSKEGFVKKARLLSASHELFVENALKTLSSARYVPRIVDGEFVATDEVKKKFRFVYWGN